MTTRSAAAPSGPFLLFIRGDLKDLVRCEAAHGIWTDIALYPEGPDGEGNARVQRWTEAANVYKFLTGSASRMCDNKKLTVHFWDIGGENARFITCNCGNKHSTFAQGQEVTRKAMDHRAWLPISPPMSTREELPPYHTAASAQQSAAALMQSMSRLQIQNGAYCEQAPVSRVYAANYSQQPPNGTQGQASITPHYGASHNGQPVNLKDGYAVTEARGVFVSNIDFRTRSKELEDLFSKVGTVVKCKIQKDAATGKSKGNAQVQFSTAAEAQRAVDAYHKRKCRGVSTELRVRIDREEAIITPPSSANANTAKNNGEPIIVDGSRRTR